MPIKVHNFYNRPNENGKWFYIWTAECIMHIIHKIVKAPVIHFVKELLNFMQMYTNEK